MSFPDNAHRASYKRVIYFFPTIEIKDYNVMIDEKNFFDQPVKNDIKTHDNIKKIAIAQRDDYATGCFLDYVYIENYYKMIVIDLSKPQTLDVDRKTVLQTSLTENLDRAGNTAMFFIIEEAKETILDFSQGNVKVL